MRIGLVCPYQWDVPGGVQYHVRDLAETLRGMGHHVEVLTPAEREESLPAEHATWAGRTVPVPYNGSMASMQFGPVSAARVRRWLREGHFDVVHVHEPASPSVSLLVCMIAKGPVVATFHAATTRSKWLAAVGPMARPWLEKISGRIAVSDFARRVQVEHLGGDAVIIPNGVHVAAFADGPALPGHTRGVDGPTIGFLGRYDEPRKGLPVLLEAMRTVVRKHPGAQLLVAGRGDPAEARAADRRGPAGPRRAPRRAVGGGQGRVPAVGRRLLRAQPAGGVLRRHPHRGPGRRGADRRQRPGRLRPRARARRRRRARPPRRRRRRSPGRCATCSPTPRGARSSPRAGARVAAGYDWDVLARRILAVYETVLLPDGGEVTAGDDDDFPDVPPARPAAWSSAAAAGAAVA